MIDEMLKKAEEKMLEKNPSMSDENIEMAMKYTKMFMNPVWMSIWSVIGSTFMSFIASLIISIFTKKKDNSFESNFR
jgi:ABC-type arginine/histidine transport system permease subunit